MNKGTVVAAFLISTISTGSAAVLAEDPPAMFGLTPSRNMVSTETGVPTDWDILSGRNIKWKQKLGSQTYAGPIIYDGKVFVGTNNEGERRPGIVGDKGILIAFRESDGELLWQATHDKLPAGRVNDWPLQGICSTPYIEDGVAYYVSNRAEFVAVDVDGFADGNDGMQDEQYSHEQDADILWIYDTIAELDVFPHNLAAGSPIVVGDVVVATTGQGVDEGHINIPSPLGPSFVALNKHTGELVWESAHPMENILHGTWSNPAAGVAGGREQIVIPGGEGVVYSFAPDTGELIWTFDANPKESVWELGGKGSRNNIISTPVFHHDVVYIGVGQDPEHGEGPGHFYKIDASGTGDITETGTIWHVGGEDFQRTMSTAAVHDGLVYIADLSGHVYCFDEETGELQWMHHTYAAIWGSTFVVDGKIYIGDEDGEVAILATGREENLINEVFMEGAVYTTPFAKDGVLYVATRSELYAIEEGAQLASAE